MGQMLADPEPDRLGRKREHRLPTFKDGGTHMNISGVAMTKAAPNREAALQLMEFLASDEAQKIYAETITNSGEARRARLGAGRKLGPVHARHADPDRDRGAASGGAQDHGEVNFDG